MNLGAFVAGGWRKGEGVLLQCRQRELLQGLHRSLTADWRHIYRRCRYSHTDSMAAFLLTLHKAIPKSNPSPNPNPNPNPTAGRPWMVTASYSFYSSRYPSNG